MATLAVFIALGGSSYAAFKVTGRDVKDGSLTYRDLKRNTLGGSRIKESRLATVPRARNALRVGGLSADRLLLKCPAGTRPVVDVCAEVALRPAAPYGSAVGECKDTDNARTPGRRLPSHQEVMGILAFSDINPAPGGELTSDVYPGTNPGDPLTVLVVTSETGAYTTTLNTYAGRKPFRCVADPLN